VAFHLDIPFKDMKMEGLKVRNLCCPDATNKITFVEQFSVDYCAEFGPAW